MSSITTSNTLITGGAGGLGRELVRHYADRGHVTVLDVDQANGELLLEAHPEVTFACADLAKFTSEMLPDAPGAFDTVICNAGISVSGNFADIASDREEQVFAVNCLGHIRLVKLLLRQRRLRPGARLAFICSATSFLPFPIAVSYAASKAALDGFAAALEPYVRGEGMSVTRVYPGPMRTDHARHYDGYDQGKGVDPAGLVRGIARGIAKRKRRVLPDRASKCLYWAAKVPGLLPRLAHRQYSEHFEPFGSPEDPAP